MDSLGDRMKTAEACFEHTLPWQIPTIVRVDGKAFHTLTKKLKLEKPYDEFFHSCMVKVAIKLCENIQNARIAYTQSDEISILIYPKTVVAQPWFGCRIEKIVSVAAGTASSYLTWLLKDRLKESCYIPEEDTFSIFPCFDARVFSLPTHDVINYFWWRQKDAIRNSISAYAQSNFGPKNTFGLNTQDLVVKLKEEKSIDWHKEPTWKKWGSAVIHHTFEKSPGVVRSEWKAADHFPKLLEDDSIFDGLLDTPVVPMGCDDGPKNL